MLLSFDSSTEERRRGVSRRRGDDKLRFAVLAAAAAAAAANAAFSLCTAQSAGSVLLFSGVQEYRALTKDTFVRIMQPLRCISKKWNTIKNPAHHHYHHPRP